MGGHFPLLMDAGLADLIACVAAFGRSLQEKFDPQRFLAEFSSRAQRLIPHDRMVIASAEDEGRTFTVFAEDPGQGPLLHQGRYTTDFDPGSRYTPEQLGFGAILAGEPQLVEDFLTDPRFAGATPETLAPLKVGVRARIVVPLHGGSRIIGAFLVASLTPGVYTDAHVATLGQIADLIGPFVENVVFLHRERRRRRRLQAVTALAPILGASLKVGDLINRLGEAVCRQNSGCFVFVEPQARIIPRPGSQRGRFTGSTTRRCDDVPQWNGMFRFESTTAATGAGC